ncbi:MAG TPA: hypothetical protein VHY35_13750 [Stellaceae bacterium]|jgi:hypothetical protein|nr:hypothetical protein [Stellaceae bacterium]
MFAQLKQWPPTSTTVIGVGLLLGVGCYFLTGSVEGAVALAGFFKIICPQDAAAVDQAVGEIRTLATTPKP